MNSTTYQPTTRARARRLVTGVGAALLALAASASGAWADMSIGKNTAAFDGDGVAMTQGDISTLATVTISKVRRHTVILVDATVSDIDQGVNAQVYLSIGGVLSGPVTECHPTAGECTLTFHRPIDVDENGPPIGEPMTFSLLAYTPDSDPSVQVGFTAHVVKK
jgi:hypothetical protein